VLESGEMPGVLLGAVDVLDPVVPDVFLVGVGRLTPCNFRQLLYAANFSAAALLRLKPFEEYLGRRPAQAASAFLNAGLVVKLWK